MDRVAVRRSDGVECLTVGKEINWRYYDWLMGNFSRMETAGRKRNEV